MPHEKSVMKTKDQLAPSLRVIGFILAVTQIFMAAPVRVYAAVATSPSATSVDHHQSSAESAAENVRINRVLPETTAPRQFPQFSDEPTDAEISKARVFEEPLIAVAG